MIDDLREEEIVNKVGGRFKLSTLIQKRMVRSMPEDVHWWILIPMTECRL